MTDSHTAAETGLAQGILSALEQKKPWTLFSLAREFNITEREAAEALPPRMCAFAPENCFFTVWEDLASWEKATFIVQHEGHVIEVQGRLPSGKLGHGYYNLAEGGAIGGHLRAEDIAEIAFLSMPFMGLESHSVQFFNAGGHVVFSVYAGRERHSILPSVKEAFLNMKKRLAGA